MISWLKKAIVGKMGRSVIRKLMTLLAGVLVGIGIEPEVIEQFTSSGTEVLIAAFLYIVAQVWSMAERQANQKLLDAKCEY